MGHFDSGSARTDIRSITKLARNSGGTETQWKLLVALIVESLEKCA